MTQTVNNQEEVYYQRVFRGMWLALLVAYFKEIGTDFLVARGLVTIQTKIEPVK